MRFGLAVAILAALVDQGGKAWVLRLFASQPEVHAIRVTPFFNLVVSLNRGISFGMFNNNDKANAAIFAVIAAVIVAGLLAWLGRAQDRLLELGIGLVIGGAVGNVVDRLVRGAVVDFLDFHAGDWHWFVFNLADAAISVGVALMLIDGLRGRREARN